MREFPHIPSEAFGFKLTEIDSVGLSDALVRRIRHHANWCLDKGAGDEFVFVRSIGEPGNVSLYSRLVRLNVRGGAIEVLLEREYPHPPQTGMMYLVNQVADRMPEGLAVVTFSSESGVDSSLTYLNETMATILGGSKASMIGMSELALLDIMHEEARLQWRAAIDAFGSADIQARIKKLDGSQFTASLQRNVVVDATGWHSQAVILCRDIESQIAAQASRDRQRDLIERMQVLAKMGWWELKDDGELYWSQGMYALYDQTEDIAPTPADIIAKVVLADQSRLRATLSQTRNKGEDASAEIRVLNGGEEHWHRVQTFPGRMEEGQVRSIIGTSIDITDIVQSEQRRLQQHQELQFYLGCLDDHALLLKLDHQYRVVFANTKFFQAVGYEPGEMIGIDLASLILSGSPDTGSNDANEVSESYEYELLKAGRWRGELTLRRQSGGYVILETMMSRAPNDDFEQGEDSEVFVVAYDITRRKIMEAVGIAVSELRRLDVPVGELTLKTLRYLVDISGAKLAWLQADGVDLHWPLDSSPVSIERETRETCQFVVQFQEEVPGVLTLYGFPGRLAQDAQELFRPLVDVIVEAERNRRISASGRQLQFENRFILETLKIGSWRRDLSTKTWFFSDSLFNLLEYPASETVSQDLWEERIPETEQRKLRQSLKRMIDTGETCEATVLAVLPDGKQKHLKIQGRVLRNLEGKPREVLGIAADVTDEVFTRRELEDQKSLASHQARLASIGELASGVGHEINNPLTIIRGFVEIIRHQLASDAPRLDDISELVAKIDDSAGRIERIVQGLRSLSHVDGVVTESFSPEPILRETIGFVDEIYRRHGISLEMVSDVPLSLRLSGHEGKVQQILMNLLSNARDATEGQAERIIFVQFQVEGNALIISVADNGPGVGADIKQRIFDPFFTTKDIGKGTGIGLSIVYSIIQEFEGSIDCLTSDMGGAEFRVMLPVMTINVDTLPTPPETKKTPIVQELVGKVLVVDDEDGVREFIKLMLTQLGLEVDVATNGGEALERVNEVGSPYDLVITDLTMPGMSGLEFVKAMQESLTVPPNVLITTGRPDFAFNNEEYPTVVGLLPKPFNLKSIRSKLDQLNLPKKAS